MNFAFISKESYFIFESSLVFTFHLKRELDSSFFSVLATKYFHIAGPPIDIWNLVLCSNFWFAIETCWV